MRKSELRIQSKDFAKHIVFAYRSMRNDGVEYPLITQLLRSGTSIGANIFESEFAQSTKDYVSKFKIALKECNETSFWLDLLHETDSMNTETYVQLKNECDSISRMLAASIKTLGKSAGIDH